MARPVKIDTPVPTLEEFGEKFGLSKAWRKSLAPVFIERRPQADYAVTRSGSGRAIKVFSAQREAVESAREVSPNGTCRFISNSRQQIKKN
jgi:hypothetical protein